MIIPGEKINDEVVVTDDLDKHINASFWATITEKLNGARLDSTTYSTLITDKIRVKGKPSRILALDLNILSPRQSYINLDAPNVSVVRRFHCNYMHTIIIIIKAPSPLYQLLQPSLFNLPVQLFNSLHFG